MTTPTLCPASQPEHSYVVGKLSRDVSGVGPSGSIVIAERGAQYKPGNPLMFLSGNSFRVRCRSFGEDGGIPVTRIILPGEPAEV